MPVPAPVSVPVPEAWPGLWQCLEPAWPVSWGREKVWTVDPLTTSATHSQGTTVQYSTVQYCIVTYCNHILGTVIVLLDNEYIGDISEIINCNFVVPNS